MIKAQGEKALIGLSIRAVLQAVKAIEDAGEKAKRKMPVSEMPGEILGKLTDVHVYGDILSEQVMSDVLNDYGKKYKIKFYIYSEEIGVVIVGDLSDDAVEVTAVFDGIDGTTVYSNNGHAGPMFSMAYGYDPKYAKFFVNLVGDLITNTVIVACDEFRRIYWLDESFKDLNKISSLHFDTKKIFSDNYTKVSKLTWKHGQAREHDGSTAYMLWAMCLSATNDLDGISDIYTVGMLLDATRKLNLEQPTVYGLVTRFGGLYLALDGTDVGDQKYLEWCMNPDHDSLDQMPVIIAANQEYADYALANLRL